MRRLLLFTSCFALGAAFAYAQPAAGKLDPCALVTKADIQQAAGASVTDGKLNANNKEVCEYQVGSGGIVNFVIRKGGIGENADKMMSELAKRKIATTETKGVGDRAFFASMGYGMVQLNAFKGAHYLIVTALLPMSGEPKTKAFCEELARKALAKL